VRLTTDQETFQMTLSSELSFFEEGYLYTSSLPSLPNDLQMTLEALLFLKRRGSLGEFIELCRLFWSSFDLVSRRTLYRTAPVGVR